MDFDRIAELLARLEDAGDDADAFAAWDRRVDGLGEAGFPE